MQEKYTSLSAHAKKCIQSLPWHKTWMRLSFVQRRLPSSLQFWTLHNTWAICSCPSILIIGTVIKFPDPLFIYKPHASLRWSTILLYVHHRKGVTLSTVASKCLVLSTICITQREEVLVEPSTGLFVSTFYSLLHTSGWSCKFIHN